MTGSRRARLDGGSVSSGYVLHLDRANYVQVDAITITIGQKALVLDQSSHNVLDNLDVHKSGNELVVLRNFSSDNVVSSSSIHDSGHLNPGYGEGIYIGLAKSNWGSAQSRTSGSPDTSNRNQVIGNRLYGTTAQHLRGQHLPDEGRRIRDQDPDLGHGQRRQGQQHPDRRREGSDKHHGDP